MNREFDLLLVADAEFRWCAACAAPTPHDRADAEAFCALCGAALFLAGALAWPASLDKPDAATAHHPISGHAPRAA
jgi:hypothetical protein